MYISISYVLHPSPLGVQKMTRTTRDEKVNTKGSILFGSNLEPHVSAVANNRRLGITLLNRHRYHINALATSRVRNTIIDVSATPFSRTPVLSKTSAGPSKSSQPEPNSVWEKAKAKGQERVVLGRVDAPCTHVLPGQIVKNINACNYLSYCTGSSPNLSIPRKGHRREEPANIFTDLVRAINSSQPNSNIPLNTSSPCIPLKDLPDQRRPTRVERFIRVSRNKVKPTTPLVNCHPIRRSATLLTAIF